jgi:hypothetical protein
VANPTRTPPPPVLRADELGLEKKTWIAGAIQVERRRRDVDEREDEKKTRGVAWPRYHPLSVYLVVGALGMRGVAGVEMEGRLSPRSVIWVVGAVACERWRAGVVGRLKGMG